MVIAGIAVLFANPFLIAGAAALFAAGRSLCARWWIIVAILLIVPANRRAAARLEREIEQLEH